jgi:hypothetical protein
VFLSACGEHQPENVPGDAPANPATVPVTESATATGHPDDGEQDETAPVPDELRTLESLNLKLIDKPATLQAPPGFGAAPDSGWLDQGPEMGELDAEGNGLLPDLFDGKAPEKPVDIKGRMLIDDGGTGISDSLEGAEISIEIQTDQ